MARPESNQEVVAIVRDYLYVVAQDQDSFDGAPEATAVAADLRESINVIIDEFLGPKEIPTGPQRVA